MPTFRRLLGLLRPFTGWMALAALLGFATIGSSIGLMATSAYIIAKAALHPSIAALQVAIAGVRFFGLARGVFRYLERYVSHQVTFRLLARLRVWFYAAVEPLAPARLLSYRSGDLFSRIIADIESLEHFYLRVLAPPLVAGLIFLLMGLFMAAFNLRLAAFTLLFLLLAGVGLPLLTYRLSRGWGRRLITVRADLNALVLDTVQGSADLLLAGQSRRQQDRVGELSRRLTHTQEHVAWVTGLHSAASGLLANWATLAILLVAIPLVNLGQLDGVYLAVLVLAAIASFEAVIPLPEALQHLESSLTAARRLFDLLDAQPAVPIVTTPSPTPLHFGLTVKNLSFRYQETNRSPAVATDGEKRWGDTPPAPRPAALKNEAEILQNISFNLAPGRRVAIVGPSGAGKTSLVHLLLRFWDYQTGSIELGGHNLRRYRPDDVRQLISVVSQQTHLFNGTIRDNLLLARPQASQVEIVQAAQQAHLHHFIQTLPGGYDTWVGEQGVRLSGGERQRLAIARTLLRNAPLLLLDEPTAHLDPLIEAEVMQDIRTLMAGRTTLLITHRLIGLETMDEILVLQAGRIVERGQHHELIQAQGLYSHLLALQQQMVGRSASPESPS